MKAKHAIPICCQLFGARTTVLLTALIWSALCTCAYASSTSGSNLIPSSSAPSVEVQAKLSGISATYQNGFGIVADIHNVSSLPIWLNPRWVTLTPPPELEPDQSNSSWYATIIGRPTSQPGSDKFDKFQQLVVLAPGETVPAVWTPIGKACSTEEADEPAPAGTLTVQQFKNWFGCKSQQLSQAINFAPGDYTMKIVVNSWNDKVGALVQTDDYKTQTSEIKVTVTATQWIIIFGALCGAVGAYFVVPNVRTVQIKGGERYWFNGLFQDARGIVSASLFAVIVTILLARLSDTSFLLKVTVSDFWGAIAIGFLATATRKTILEKIAPAARPPAAA